jgi:hypothetical protein
LEVLSRPLGTGETVSTQNTNKKIKHLVIGALKNSRMRRSEDVDVTYPEGNHFVTCLREKQPGSSAQTPTLFSLSQSFGGAYK